MDSQFLVSEKVLPARAMCRKALCYRQDELLYYVLLLTRQLFKTNKSDYLLIQPFLLFISFSFFFFLVSVYKGATTAFMINFMLLQTGYYFSLCSLSQSDGITPSSPLKPVPNNQGNSFSSVEAWKFHRWLQIIFILLAFWNNVKKDTDKPFFPQKTWLYNKTVLSRISHCVSWTTKSVSQPNKQLQNPAQLSQLQSLQIWCLIPFFRRIHLFTWYANVSV